MTKDVAAAGACEGLLAQEFYLNNRGTRTGNPLVLDERDAPCIAKCLRPRNLRDHPRAADQRILNPLV